MMAFRKTVVGSFSWAVMGFALTGAALGQVSAPGVTNPGAATPGVTAPGVTAPGATAPGIADGSIIRNGQINAETATDAGTPAADAAATVDANVQNNVDANVGAQTRGDQSGRNATIGTDRQNLDSRLNGNARADVNGLNNSSNVGQDSSATANLNPFGATFDSSTSNQLIIQDLQANSAASRLGLQAGDRIIEFNGQTYTDVNQFDRDLVNLNGNTDIPIVYERNGMRYTKNFRMSSQNSQQTYHDSTYGNQGFNNQSGNFGQSSHSANRPMYGTSSNGAYSSGMEHHQGYHGGAAAYGSHSSQGQVCCGGAVTAQHHGSGHRHGGRRHRRCCR